MLSVQKETGGLVEQVLSFVRDHDALIEIVLFLLAFAESIVLTSVFVPSTLLLVAIGALEGAAAGPLLPLVLAAACGALAGDMLSFAVGKHYCNTLHDVWPLNTQREIVLRTHAFMARWGVLAVVLSKLTGPLRPVVPMLAGASLMPWSTFAVASIVSTLAWSALFLVPAYYGFQAVFG
ncbi:MAG: DedA family protein [Hyphomicrobiaceae bacterium]